MRLITKENNGEEHWMNGADFGTSELICPINKIINGFSCPYPLNGNKQHGGFY